TNRSFGLIQSFRRMQGPDPARNPTTSTTNTALIRPLPFRRPGGHGEGANTRSHPELGRENPQRQWYCVLRRGRVGRRQALQGPEDRPRRTEDGNLPPHPPHSRTHSLPHLSSIVHPPLPRGGAA